MLSATLDVELYGAKYRLQKKPKPFDCELIRKRAEDASAAARGRECVERWLETGRTGMHLCIEQNRMCEAMRIWAVAAEDYLTTMQGLAGREKTMHEGRSAELTFEERKSTARIRRKRGGDGAITHRHTEIASMQRKVLTLAAMLRKRDRLGEAEVSGEMSQRELGAIENLREKIERASLHLSLPLSENWPSADSIQLMAKKLRKALEEEEKQARNRRTERGKQEAAQDWEEGGRGLYRRVRPPPPPPTLVLARADGTLTANPREMQNLVT